MMAGTTNTQWMEFMAWWQQVVLIDLLKAQFGNREHIVKVLN